MKIRKFSDFDNHIYVTTDAETFFFLHDLITSYMREKERVRVVQLQQQQQTPSVQDRGKFGSLARRDFLQTSEGASSASSSSSGQPTLPQSDWRVFECGTWHLEPTVRLISWAGSEIEPYGVDYILQRLGFTHARVTIPKWLQRGCMDPLDKALSVIVLRAIQLVQEEKHEREAAENAEEPNGLYEKRSRP